MKSISFQWTEGVAPWEAETVVSTVAHIQEVMLVLGQRAGLSLNRGELRPFGTWVIPGIPRGSPYWSTRWYVDQSLDKATGQIYAPKFINVLRDEPWQQVGPHYDVAIVHADLLDAPERNAGGASDPHVLASTETDLAAVLSMHRLRRIPEHDDRRMAVRRLATRSFGQVLDLPGPDRKQAVDLVHGQRVCTNVCVMRAAPRPEDILELARQEHRSRIVFCRDCTNDLLDQVVATHFSQN